MLVYLTGATGFFGAHLRKELSTWGHSVVHDRHADVDLLQPINAIERVNPDAVIHCAATVGGIGANRLKPATFWRENLIMGMNVLDACRRAGTKKLVMIGTTCSYPKYATIPFTPDKIFDGYPEDTNAPYGIAKRALLVGAEAYRKEFGLKTITLIPTNLYGPHDHFDPTLSHVIPALIRKFCECQEGVVTLWGTGQPTRDFLYAPDAAQGIAMALEGYDLEVPLNLGSGREISIKELAEIVAHLCGSKAKIVWDSKMPDGQPRRLLDTSATERAIGWSASTDLLDGLEATIDWYRKTECRSTSTS